MIPYISIEKIKNFSGLVSKNIEDIKNELEELEEEDTYHEIKKNMCKLLIKLNSLGCYTIQGQPYINDNKLYQRSYIVSMINKKNKEDIEYFLKETNFYYSLNSVNKKDKYLESSNIDKSQIILIYNKNTMEKYTFNSPSFYNESNENFLSFIEDICIDHENKCSENFFRDIVCNYMFLFLTTKEDKEDKEDKEIIEKTLIYIFENINKNINWFHFWLIIIFIFYLTGFVLYIFSIFK
jgi:hypothetical protein